MRDDQRRRYARHVAIDAIGERGQDALLAATARVGDDPASRVAAAYLAASGVTVVEGSRASDHGPRAEVCVPPRPPWWPGDDDHALELYRGATAAALWMLERVGT